MNVHKCLKITCWIFFIIHFSYIIIFHGILNICIAKCDFVLDILMLIALNSVGLFMSLSQSHGISTADFTFFKCAIFFSFLNLIFIILSIVYISYNFFFVGPVEKKEHEKLPATKPFMENYIKELKLKSPMQEIMGIILISFKTLETIPFFLLLHNYIKTKSYKNILSN